MHTNPNTLMRTARTFALATLLCLVWSMIPNTALGQKKAKELTEKDLQKMYMEFLTADGYRPEVDSDGDVQFKEEGKTYFIDVSADDQEYFRIVLANIWPIESEEERLRVLQACDYANATAKVCKAYTVRDNVWVGIEVFVAKPEDFKGVFKRSMSALRNGTMLFVKKMREND
jgi:hypothetical protein